MSEATIDGRTYRIGIMPVMDQFKVAKKLGPIITRVGPELLKAIKDASPEGASAPKLSVGADKLGDLLAGFSPLAQALAEMPDADSDFILSTTLRAVKVIELDGRAESAFWNSSNRAPNYADVALPTLFQLVMRVIGESLGGFTLGRPSA